MKTKESGRVEVPYELINKLHALRTKLNKGKPVFLRELVIKAIEDFLEKHK
jgi:predicted DNA-binding protein